MAQEQLTDSQKIDILNRRIKRLEASTHVQTAILVLGFIGIVSFASLMKDAKKIINS
jgi:hypothetical protein